MEVDQNHMVCRVEVGYPVVPVRFSRSLGSPLLELDDMAEVYSHQRMARTNRYGDNLFLPRPRNGTARSKEALPAVG